MDRQITAVNRCIASMDAAVDEISSAPTIGHVAWFCALAHLDFRFTDEPWRPLHPKLARWHERFAERPSAKATPPHD